MKKQYQPQARHSRLRTRVAKDQSKYNRNQLTIPEYRDCDCWLEVGKCECLKK